MEKVSIGQYGHWPRQTWTDLDRPGHTFDIPGQILYIHCTNNGQTMTNLGHTWTNCPVHLCLFILFVCRVLSFNFSVSCLWPLSSLKFSMAIFVQHLLSVELEICLFHIALQSLFGNKIRVIHYALHDVDLASRIPRLNQTRFVWMA